MLYCAQSFSLSEVLTAAAHTIISCDYRLTVRCCQVFLLHTESSSSFSALLFIFLQLVETSEMMLIFLYFIHFVRLTEWGEGHVRKNVNEKPDREYFALLLKFLSFPLDSFSFFIVFPRKSKSLWRKPVQRETRLCVCRLFTIKMLLSLSLKVKIMKMKWVLF